MISDLSHYRAGSGTPLVLLHAGGMSWRAWKPVLPGLSAHHDVYAPTMAAHRGGPVLAPDEPFTPLVLADHVERQLDALGLDTVHLAGNSLGGWVSIELARRGRARSVVGLSPAGVILGEWQSRMVALGGLFARQMARGVVATTIMRSSLVRRAALLTAMLHGERMTTADVVDVFADARVGNRHVNDLMTWALAHGSVAPIAHHPFPIRLAWAQHDFVLPYRTYGRRYVERFPDAEAIMLPGVGHVPMHDDPALVIATIREITAAVDGESPPRRAFRRLRAVS